MADCLDKFVVEVEGLEREDNRAGSGAYGVVFKVTVSGRDCIAKKLHNILLRTGEYYPVDQRDSIIEKFRNECSLLSGLNHPNIVSFVGVHYGRDKNDISLIMERLHTDLAAFVHSQPKTPTSQRIHILWDVSKGLEYLHSLTPPLIHRDLTAPNVLLTKDLMAKIGDLGVSRYLDPEKMTHTLTKAPGNVYYMSPEARAETPVYTVKLDIFSFGTLIMHTFIGSVPKVHDVPYDERAVQLSRDGKIELTRRRKAVDQLGETHCMYPLIVRCLHDKPDPRPTASEVIESLRELCLKYPTIDFQRGEINTALKQELKAGETWFLVDIHWMKQWKKYVGYDPQDQSSAGEESANPGPLDNSHLLTGGNLCEGLESEVDCCLLPESAWSKFSIWYGLSSGSKVIPRKVVMCGYGLVVEVYLLEMRISVYPNIRNIRRRKFSRANTVADLERAMREEFEVSSSTDCRVWKCMMRTYKLLRPNQTLQEAGLSEIQQITFILEKKNADGSWPQETLPAVQKVELESDLKQELRKGETWYIVTSHWLRQWKRYVGITVCRNPVSPGPVNNEHLFYGNKLQNNLLEKSDYSFLPESAWDKLCFWYGLTSGSKPIPRTVIECDPDTKNCTVEVYPVVLNLCFFYDQSNIKRKEFSRADTVVMLEHAARMEFDLTNKCKVWYESQNGDVLLSEDETLLEAGVQNGQTVFFVEHEVSIDIQKRLVRTDLQQQLKKGDTWYLVDIRWMKQWKKYVGYDTWDQTSAGKESANPGPLENSSLFKDDCLCDHLMDELNYSLLSESAWKKLLIWYGLNSGSKVIPRKVVEYGLYMKHCKVEVYLLEFKLCVHPYLNGIKKRELSRADSVADLESAMREEFEIPSSTECRVWHRYMTHTYELLSRSDQSLQEAGLYNGQTVVLEMKNSDGTWPRTTS